MTKLLDLLAHKLVRSLAVACSILAAAAIAAPGPEIVPRIVAVGDVHGDFDSLAAILRKTGIIDENNQWAGGKSIFVQTGDFLDRGAQSREVMDLFMQLEKDAPRQGGRAVILLGNHEVMNIMGDLRYVVTEDYAGFADPKSPQRRQEACEDHLKWFERRSKIDKTNGVSRPAEFKDEWMEKHPPGFVERRSAFSRRGKYGNWLRAHDAAVRIGDTIFLHGGISPQSVTKVSEINGRLHREIEVFDSYAEYMQAQGLILPFFTLDEVTRAAQADLQHYANRAERGVSLTDSERDHLRSLNLFLGYGGWLVVNPEGPLWFRGYAHWPDNHASVRDVAEILKKQKAAHVVVGHTPQLKSGTGRIESRFGGMVFLIDTGMLSSYYPGGRPAALEIQDGKFSAIYLDQRETLLQ